MTITISTLAFVSFLVGALAIGCFIGYYFGCIGDVSDNPENNLE